MSSVITSQFVQVNNIKLHYLSGGQGAPILFLHGWPTSSYLWRNILPKLAQQHRVIAIDLPGYGQSDKRLEDSYSFRYHSRVLSGLLDQLEIEKVTLGLHDAGGPIGLYWMAQHMERVDRLILFNTLVYPEFSMMVKLFGLATKLPLIRSILTSPLGIKRSIYFGVAQKEKLTEEIIHNYQQPFQDKTSRKVLLKVIQRLGIQGFKEAAQQLSSFTGPVQAIYGEKDKILPWVGKTMERVQQDLPQTRIHALSNSGHFLQEDEPEKIADLVLEFMASTT